MKEVGMRAKKPADILESSIKKMAQKRNAMRKMTKGFPGELFVSPKNSGKLFVMEECKMAKYAWVWNIKPEYVDEYVKMHQNPWPEIMKAHSEAGFRNYSIFRNGRQFIYVFECDGDPKEVFAKACADESCIRWNAITSKMIDKEIKDGKVDAGVEYLPEVFYLK